MPFISACVNLQQQSGCTIDLESLGIRQRQKRLFILDASDNLYETGVFFRFHRLHWVWNLVQVEPDLSKETCEEQEVEMDIIYGIKIISWRLGGRHTQPLASLQQQSGCAIDLESLGIRQRQKRLFILDASDNLYETGVFFRFHRLHWVWNLVQVEPDLSNETCEEQEMEMDIIWNQDNFMEARRSPHTQPLAAVAFMCHLVPQKPIYASRASPVRKAPCCNGFKCTSNSKQASKPFLPSGTEDQDPTTDFEIFVLALQPRTTL